MQQTGSKTETLEAWADIVEKIWREKIVAMKVWESGDLYRSILNHLLVQSGGDVAKIEFLFRKYGLYANMGVGREFSHGNSGDIGYDKGIYHPNREPKPWFDPFYRQVHRLVEILQEKFAMEATDTIASTINSLNDFFDQRYSDKHGRAVSSLKTVMYRNQQSVRNSRNYQRRRAFDGRWQNDSKTWKPDGGIRLKNIRTGK